jgi:hypothetical protein
MSERSLNKASHTKGAMHRQAKAPQGQHIEQEVRAIRVTKRTKRE